MYAKYITSRQRGVHLPYAVTFAIYALAHRIRCQAHGQEFLIIAFSSSLFAARTRNFKLRAASPEIDGRNLRARQ